MIFQATGSSQFLSEACQCRSGASDEKTDMNITVSMILSQACMTKST